MKGKQPLRGDWVEIYHKASGRRRVAVVAEKSAARSLIVEDHQGALKFTWRADGRWLEFESDAWEIIKVAWR